MLMLLATTSLLLAAAPSAAPREGATSACIGELVANGVENAEAQQVRNALSTALETSHVEVIWASARGRKASPACGEPYPAAGIERVHCHLRLRLMRVGPVAKAEVQLTSGADCGDLFSRTWTTSAADLGRAPELEQAAAGIAATLAPKTSATVVTATPAAAPDPVPAAAVDSGAATATESASWPILPLSLVAAGGTSLILSGTFYGLALDRHACATDRTCVGRQVAIGATRTWETGAVVALGVGLACGAAALLLWPSSQDTAVALVPIAGRQRGLVLAVTLPASP
jgi:hypothetical protein